MKEYRKHTTEWILLLLFVAMITVYCTPKPETPSRTVDEIIEHNRQIRADTTLK